ncbi:MAG: hypothetical protein QM754_06880 [Tepidisphaeraceae bacterium]
MARRAEAVIDFLHRPGHGGDERRGFGQHQVLPGDGFNSGFNARGGGVAVEFAGEPQCVAVDVGEQVFDANAFIGEDEFRVDVLQLERLGRH